MSSYHCFICHSSVNSDTNEDIRGKYLEAIGMNLCPESHLCHICCHKLNKFWLFKSICLKRSLEHTVLFGEGDTNLQRSEIECHILCPEETCCNQTIPFNCTSQHINYCNEYERYSDYNDGVNQYVELHDDRNDFDNHFTNLTKISEAITNEMISERDNGAVYIGAGYDATNIRKDNQYNNLIDNENYVDETNDLENNGYNNSVDNENNVGQIVIKDEIENDLNIETDATETHERQKRKKSKKHKKCGFKNKLLTLEEQKRELDARRKQKKYLDAEFKCFSCALGFLFKDTYQAHMMRHEESNGEYRCEVCTLRFASLAVLRSHQMVHARGCDVKPPRTMTERATPCHLCGRVFRDPSRLQQHLKRFHQSKTSSRTYSCSVCGKVYNNQAAVRTHLIKHINRKFTCELCPSTFSSPYTLNQHKKRHESVAQEQHYCDVCKVGYNTRKSLLAHKRNALVHQQTVFECPICRRICPNQRALISHQTTVHSTSKDYACHLCRAQYTSRKSLMRHISGHTKPQEARDVHVCNRCPRTFKSRSKLNRHLREVCEKDNLEEELSTINYQ